MSIDSTHDLFVSSLKHTYYAEQRIMEALEELEETTTNDEIASGFGEHRTETQSQLERLEDVFEKLDMEPAAEEDPIVEGLISAHEEFMDVEPSPEAIDRYNIFAGQKVEHYEIAAYGNLIPMADQLGMDDVADLLEENLREEQDELETLAENADQFDYGDLEAEG